MGIMIPATGDSNCGENAGKLFLSPLPRSWWGEMNEKYYSGYPLSENMLTVFQRVAIIEYVLFMVYHSHELDKSLARLYVRNRGGIDVSEVELRERSLDSALKRRDKLRLSSRRKRNACRRA